MKRTTHLKLPSALAAVLFVMTCFAMEEHTMAAELLEALYDPNLTPARRISLVQDSALRDRQEVIATVHEFLDAPARGEEELDWDPGVENRYLKIALIAVLHALDDRSRQMQIVDHIRAASGHASSPVLEMRAAAIAIPDIGDPMLLRKVIELAQTQGGRVAYNAVQTLELLELPEPATRSPLLGSDSRVETLQLDVRVSNLADYLGQIVDSSTGAVVLSPGTQTWLSGEGAGYVIGDGDLEEIEIPDVLTSELSLYGLTYTVDHSTVVIVTMPEAAQRWTKWWMDLAQSEETRLVKAGVFLGAVRKARKSADQEAAAMDEGDYSPEEPEIEDPEDFNAGPDD